MVVTSEDRLTFRRDDGFTSGRDDRLTLQSLIPIDKVLEKREWSGPSFFY